MRIYVASALGEIATARELADQIRRMGHEIASRWHYIIQPVEPRDQATRHVLLMSNVQDLESCDVLVALTCDGEPRCTLVEIGYALALGKPIVWIHDSAAGRNLADSHDLVVRYDVRESEPIKLYEAIETACRLARSKLTTERCEALAGGTISAPFHEMPSEAAGVG